jgi:NADH:ubiquinone oxidoreductase subunit E
MKDQTFDIKDISHLTEKWRGKQGNLIMILHEIQNKYGYVPRPVALTLSEHLGIPLARIYEVITFYNYFKLKPPGKFTISVCMGTACYLKGAPEILSEIKSVLTIEEGETTADGLFNLAPVRCLGCCSLAPVISINKTIHGRVKRKDIVDILNQYKIDE